MDLQKNHMIIGIGGTGGNILKAIRKRLFQEVKEEDRRNVPIGFVYVDSSMENMKPNDPTWKVLGENAQLGKDSFLFIRGASLGGQLENVDNYPGIRSWIGDRKIWDNLVGSVGDDGAAAQRRRLGRFLFSCAASEYESILKNQVKAVVEKSRKTDVTFHIIAGLAGGTGSGSVVDIIAQTRKHFQSDIGSGQSYKIMVYCLVPEASPLPGWDKGFYHANGYTALQELNALEVKRFIPHDVSGEYPRVPLDGVDKVFNSCFLFTNANENGITVDTKKDLPNIVSDLIFHYMTLSVDETTRAFEDAYTLENIADGEKENDETAKTQEIANTQRPARTRRFNAFGVKRIVSPEEEIVEYITYSFAKQALLQFKYNNWSDDLGYRDVQKNEDYNSFVSDRATLNRWMLSDTHLMLSEAILQSEKEQKWKTFPDEWNATIPNLANAAWAKNEARAINELAKFCEERFDKNFRKVGVPEFFKIKEKARRDLAREICDTIERDLFSQWQTGQKSVYELGRLMDTLISHSENRLKGFDAKIISRNEEIEKLYAAKAQNEQAWSSSGLLTDLMGKKKKLFQAQTTLLQQLYTKKTELEGLNFAKKLLAEVLNEMQLLNAEIKRFSDVLTSALGNAEKEINSRCQEEHLSKESFQKTVVKYYDATDVQAFTGRVTRDQQIQSQQSSTIRNAIGALAGSEPTFTNINQHITEDALMDIFSQKSRESAVHAHNELITNKKQKLIGINIVEKLKEQYGTSDKQAELNEFARNVMESSGVFLSFDKTEISRQLKNNDAPRPGVITMLNSTLISIPQSPENKEFVQKLVDAFKNNSDGSKHIYVDTASQRMNEITVINLTSCFSLRMVNNVKKLKEKYDLLLRGNNPEVARLVLHLEGDGTQYPRILMPTRAELEEERQKLEAEMLPQLLLAHVLGYISYTDRMDGTGKKAFLISGQDEFGTPLPPVVLGDRFTQLPAALEEEIAGKIRGEVKTKLSGEYLHQDKRKEVQAQLAELIKTVVLKECNNNLSDPTYARFVNAMREAITILNN
jgi:regulator of replication initiation timing